MSIDLTAVFGIGLMTLATPCVLPLLPIYLGLLLGEGVEAVRQPGGRARLFSATVAFTSGFGLVFTLLGLGASSIGGFLQSHRELLMGLGGALIVLFGLKFLGLLRLPGLDRELRLPELKTGRRLVDAALFGVVFALGWTPCVGPILGSVLTYTATRAADPATGALYLGVYSLGVATSLLVLSLFADRLVPRLGRLNRLIPVFERVTGVALLLLGLGLAVAAASRAGMLDAEESASSPEVTVAHQIGEPSERPRVVEFYREGCHACERARQRIDALREDCAGRHIEILTLDADAPSHRPLTRRYGVNVVPTFLLFDRHGEERGRLVGAPELADLRGAAASLMEEGCGGVDAFDLDELESGEPSEGEGCPSPSDDDEEGFSTPRSEDATCSS